MKICFVVSLNRLILQYSILKYCNFLSLFKVYTFYETSSRIIELFERNDTMNESRMEKEPIGKLLFSLALPTVLAQLVNLLYNIVDRIFVGRMEGVGDLALAGLGVSFPIIMLISAFAALIGMGGAPRASIFMGEKRNDQAEVVLGNCVTSLTICAVILTILFYIIKDPILLLFGASEQTLPYASSYLGIYLLGTIFVQFALGLNMFITSQGFAKTGMLTVCIGAIINILLDPIFIFVFDMGVKGAALATILSQAVSAIWVIYFLLGKKTMLKIKKENLKIKKEIMIPVLGLGMSPFVMQATECLVQLTFNKSIAYYGNDLYVTMMSILFSVMQFIWLPLQGFSQGAQPILSYNFGSGNYERVKKTFRLLFISLVAYSFLLVGTVELFPQFYISLFAPDNPELLKIGIPGIRIFMFGMMIMGAQNACQQTFLSLGEAKISMFLAFLRKLILLLPFILVFPIFIKPGTTAVLLAEAVADIIAVCITVFIFSKRFPCILKEKELHSQS